MKTLMIENILKNPTGLKLWLLNRVLWRMIPFNAPHGFRIVTLNDTEVSICLPFKRKNLNHLKGIHACALATVGEYCSGMALLQSFPPSKYRLILSKLSAEYLYQAKTEVQGQIKAAPAKIHSTKMEIESSGKALIELETVLTDGAQNLVARIKTIWQIKSWEKVRTKV